MPQSTVRLSAEQIAAYHAQGYLALDPVTTPEELAQLRAIYDRLFETRAGREEGNHFDLAGTDEEGAAPALPQILNPSKYAPELKETLLRANCDAIAAQLCGPGCIYRGDHAINKPAGSGAATPWHQDEAYWNDADELDFALSIWVPFQDVDERNGCMQFIPDSHRFEVLPHHSINNDPRIHGLEVDAGAADLTQPAICPLKAGGCTIHPARTLHYTAANQSDAPRRAYIMIYFTDPRSRETPRNFYWNKAKHPAREDRAAAEKARQEKLAEKSETSKA